jgi:hypothetical protein
MTSRRSAVAGWTVTAVAGLAVVAWAVAAFLMRDRGYTMADDGTYLVSYRFWQSNPYFVAGSQYFYGPVFDLLHESIAGLRVLRLLMVVGCNLLFAYAFLAWVEARLERRLDTAERSAVVAVLVAAGGMAYAWAPLTPGYYDLAAECSLVLVALLLLALRWPARVPWWNPALSGVVTFLLLITKWSSMGVVVISVVAVLVTLRISPGAGRRYVVAFASGAAAAVVAFHLFAMPLDEFVPVMLDVSRSSTTESHGALPALKGYALDTLTFVASALVLVLPNVAAMVAARRLWDRGRATLATVLVAVTAPATPVLVAVLAGWRGGERHGKVMVTIVLVTLVAAVVAAVPPRRPTGTWLVVAAVLFLVPVAQAGGSTVPLTHLVGQCLAPWVAMPVLACLVTRRPAWAVRATWVNLSVMSLAVAVTAGMTTVLTPFGAIPGYADETVPVSELGGLRVSAREADQYAALTDALAPYVSPGETPMVTLDARAGLTYLLDGVQLGSVWTDSASPPRTAYLVDLDCRRRDEPPGPPVLLVDRPVDAALARALRVCGASYPEDYVEVPVRGGPEDVRVFVPR